MDRTNWLDSSNNSPDNADNEDENVTDVVQNAGQAEANDWNEPEDYDEDSEDEEEDYEEGLDESLDTDSDEGVAYHNGELEQIEVPLLQEINIQESFNKFLEESIALHRARIGIIELIRTIRDGVLRIIPEENLELLRQEDGQESAVLSHLQLRDELDKRNFFVEYAMALQDGPVDVSRALTKLRNDQGEINEILADRAVEIKSEEERRKKLHRVGNFIYNQFHRRQQAERNNANRPVEDRLEEGERPNHDEAEFEFWLDLMIAQHIVLLSRTEEYEATPDMNHHRIMQSRVDQNFQRILAPENDSWSRDKLQIFRLLLTEEQNTIESRRFLYNSILKQNHQDDAVLFQVITTLLDQVIRQNYYLNLNIPADNLPLRNPQESDRNNVNGNADGGKNEKHGAEDSSKKDEQRDEARDKDPQDSREDVENELSCSNSASNIGNQDREDSQDPPQRSRKRGNQSELPVSKRAREQE